VLALYWIVRVYKYLLIAWVIMTWIPGVAGSTFHLLLGLPVIPVLAPFDFLTLGGIGFGPIIPLFILNMLEGWLAKQAGLVTEEEEQAAEQPVDPTVNVTDLKPAPAVDDTHRGI
jgi:YggT family protein